MQIIVLVLLPKGLGTSGANYAKNLLRAVIPVQYIPRLFRFIPLLIGQSPNGFIFETALANFFINLFTVVLSGHIIGLCWYLFGFQRVNQCLRDACRDSGYLDDCKKFIDCGRLKNAIEEHTQSHREKYHHQIHIFIILGIPANQYSCWKPNTELFCLGNPIYHSHNWNWPLALCFSHRKHAELPSSSR
ncbi:CYCLIC NUCLEOTIDE-GATED CATION CHANNEL PROTEIN [Salix purpurea]|uniref:CYCLIC NUCLEOTIDE-GATED CATION CHANNEL PROTEIN n=1 Tax=Salix purpurea TaxID=77065 RepID=A0A9Q1A6X1_SALPP|nr:CYCLIC NUCLEOTIDE-GATED CATION CHANNEL PROTEIN [Salix purpurea]